MHPNAHLWPAYRPAPPKPEKPLRSALAWAAVFSLVGVLVAVIAFAAVLFLLYAALWFLIASLGADVWSFWGGLSSIDWVDGVFGPVGAFVLVAAVVMFGLCTAALLLLRLGESFRRWPSPLQGLSAAGITYVLAVVVLPTIGSVISTITGG